MGTAKTWTTVVAVSRHTVARQADGSIWAWGDNSDGQLGLGDLTSRSAPVSLP